MSDTIRAAAVMAAALLVSGNLSAQIVRPQAQLADIPKVDWNDNRPDGHAPAGVVEDRILGLGEFEFGYRLMHMSFEENLVGGDSITVDALLSSFATAPIARTEQRHLVELLYGASDVITLRVAVPFVVGSFDEASAAGDGGLLVFDSEITSIGDPSLTALFSVVDNGPYRFHVGAGLSAPLGENDAQGQRAFSTPFEQVLPYQAQPGSGTWDVRPTATLKAMNEVASVGLQARGVLRLGENDRGYRLGDQLAIQFWGAHEFGDWVSGSIGVNYHNWSNVDGVDEDLAFDPEFSASPANNTLSQGGSRWELPVGMNVAFRDGLLQGYRLSGEFVLPISQNLEGPQLGADMGVTIAVTRMLGG